MPVPTDNELTQAIQSMFRVRAVESPPDEAGGRTIWHRGAKGADLVTWVDPLGKVTRQELYLFADCLVWEKGAGLRTGEHQDVLGSKLNPAPGTIAYDLEQDGARLARARSGLRPYAGDDKFILHLRQWVSPAGGAPEDETVTGPADRARRKGPLKEPAGPGRLRRLAPALVVGGLALAGLGAWLLLR